MKAIRPFTARGATNRLAKNPRLPFLALALALCISGCMVLPLPEHHSGSARANIKEETSRQFEIGKTTRADVILELGEPDAVSPDERLLAYRAEKVRAMFGCLVGNLSAPITKDLYLVAEFDFHGVLRRLAHSSRWESVNPYEMLLSAADANAVRKPGDWLKAVEGMFVASREDFYKMRKTGQLLITDRNLQFATYVATGRFANTGSELVLPFHDIAGVGVDRFSYGKRLVVRTRAGEVHSFQVWKDNMPDEETLRSVAELLQRKIRN